MDNDFLHNSLFPFPTQFLLITYSTTFIFIEMRQLNSTIEVKRISPIVVLKEKP